MTARWDAATLWVLRHRWAEPLVCAVLVGVAMAVRVHVNETIVEPYSARARGISSGLHNGTLLGSALALLIAARARSPRGWVTRGWMSVAVVLTLVTSAWSAALAGELPDDWSLYAVSTAWFGLDLGLSTVWLLFGMWLVPRHATAAQVVPYVATAAVVAAAGSALDSLHGRLQPGWLVVQVVALPLVVRVRLRDQWVSVLAYALSALTHDQVQGWVLPESVPWTASVGGPWGMALLCGAALLLVPARRLDRVSLIPNRHPVLDPT